MAMREVCVIYVVVAVVCNEREERDSVREGARERVWIKERVCLRGSCVRVWLRVCSKEGI